MSAAIAIAALLLFGGDQALTPQSPPAEGNPNPFAPRDAGTEAVNAGSGLTLDAATRERPNEVVCRDSARSTNSRIGSNRRCRTRIEWARMEAESRRDTGRATNGGLGRTNRAPIGL